MDRERAEAEARQDIAQFSVKHARAVGKLTPPQAKGKAKEEPTEFVEVCCCSSMFHRAPRRAEARPHLNPTFALSRQVDSEMERQWREKDVEDLKKLGLSDDAKVLKIKKRDPPE